MSDLDRSNELPALKPRPEDGHKGVFGYDLVVGGSVGMAGAVVLSARACLRSGAGVVRTVVPESVYQPVAAQLTCPLVFPLPDTLDGFFHPDARERCLSLAAESDAAGIGPGIGRPDETIHFVRTLLPELEIPGVVDADGLNIISEEVSLLREVDAPLVLTPHPGEFSRLQGCSVAEVQNDRERNAQRFAEKFDVVLVLKGQHTVVSDGEEVWTNDTGNEGMATGGSGDVLTGVILSLLGQGYDPYNAARIAVYLHGQAGDLVAREKGSDGLIASDLIEVLPTVFQAYRQAESSK